MLEIYAGKNALKKIQEHGFKQELFTNFLGASGGPKWFTLFGLDKYLFGEFFNNRTSTLNLIGSSAGSFRAACFAQQDPVAAIERLAKNYSETVYSEKASAAEISQKAKELLATVFGNSGAKEIIENPIFKAHFIVAKSNGLTAFENKFLQGSGLLASYVLNRIDRRLLAMQYERFIFQPENSSLALSDPSGFNTHTVPFSLENINDALLASGSIPMVMKGIENIAGAPLGMYRDGGIIDYHFDFKIKNEGLVLYPHFNSEPKAGWFDKNLSRRVSSVNYDNIVLISPSKRFVATLPYGKIPDRKDFTELDANTRISYWKTTLQQTEQLADAFASMIDKQNISAIKPFPSN